MPVRCVPAGETCGAAVQTVALIGRTQVYDGTGGLLR
ncbi:hypothetical protein NSND_63552 [Nitrospira sp. ND1]|nr:hypothetical protein NSND_63552 [Nitrospira sp. ND1]